MGVKPKQNTGVDYAKLQKNSVTFKCYELQCNNILLKKILFQYPNITKYSTTRHINSLLISINLFGLKKPHCNNNIVLYGVCIGRLATHCHTLLYIKTRFIVLLTLYPSYMK